MSDFRPRTRFSDRPRAMFKATCANCGNPCEVPFRPSGDRPIYCSNCFEKMGKGEANSRGGERRDFSRPRFEEARPGNNGQSNTLVVDQLKSLNAKLDRIVSLLEAPTVKPTAPKKKSSEKKVAELTKLVSE